MKVEAKIIVVKENIQNIKKILQEIIKNILNSFI
jgi:hypothetical protein